MAAFYFHYWVNGYWGQWLDLPAGGSLHQAATSMTLAAIVTTQIGNLFAQRAQRSSIFKVGLFSNRMAWLGIASELLVVGLITYLPALKEFFGGAAFPVEHWWFLLACAPLLLVADELRKALRRWLAKKRAAGKRDHPVSGG